MFSPVSSPEKMDYSEESSFEELPAHPVPRRTRRSDYVLEPTRRRVSCPPRPQSYQPLTQDPKLHREMATGEMGSGIENKLGFLQLDSPPNTAPTSWDTQSNTGSNASRSFLSAFHNPRDAGLLRSLSLHDARPNTNTGALRPSVFNAEAASLRSSAGSRTPSMLDRLTGSQGLCTGDTLDSCSTASHSTCSKTSKRSSLSSLFFSTVGDNTSEQTTDSDSDVSDVSTLTGRSTRTAIRAPSLRLRTLPNSHTNIANNQLETITKSSSDPLLVHSPVGSQSKCRKCVTWTLTVCSTVLLCSALICVGSLYPMQITQTCSRKVPDLGAIQSDLTKKVFGQHIAVSTIIPALSKFYDSSNMASTLVFSFHGWTGVGKNFVSGLLADGLASDSGVHVMKLIIPLHFPHENEGEIYAGQIQEWIRTNTTRCGNTVIIIDEMDKVTGAVLHGLQLALTSLRQENREDPYNGEAMYGSLSEENKNAEVTEAVNTAVSDTNGETKDSTAYYTKTLLMLLSNSGATAINSLTLEHVMSGKSRDIMTRDQFEALLLDEEYNDGDEWYGKLYKAGLIDKLVPFLPLQQSHVEMCVKSYLASENKTHIPETQIENIVQNFAYFPTDLRLFSKAGCKRVADMVALYLE